MNKLNLSKSANLSRPHVLLGQLLRISAVLGAIALLIVSASLAFMLAVGHWLVKEDSLQKANAIAVLSGNFPARALEAASLYRSGYASEIWLTHPGSQSGTLTQLGIHYPSEADFNYQVLRRQGVPAKAIHVLDSPIINTQDELDVIGGALHQKKNASVIVVTNKAHTRRVHELWNKLDSTSGKLIVHGISNDDFNPSAWWTRTGDTHQVIHELLGMINLWAGLPMQSTPRARESVARNEFQQAPKFAPVLPQDSSSGSDD
ncbi:MAG TPA: YdcF family protein [Candidatus Acidoferrum sp.]|nr:YdcF family protein [Candidatus Acidoferrum sp.]